MDLIVGLPESRRRSRYYANLPDTHRRTYGKAYNAILVVTDRYTKMAHYFPV
jgi:hypothetical protein